MLALSAALSLALSLAFCCAAGGRCLGWTMIIWGLALLSTLLAFYGVSARETRAFTARDAGLQTGVTPWPSWGWGMAALAVECGFGVLEVLCVVVWNVSMAALAASAVLGFWRCCVCCV